MDIHLVSTLTADDEIQIAPALLRVSGEAGAPTGRWPAVESPGIDTEPAELDPVVPQLARQ